MTLTEAHIQKYARQLVLPEIGGLGQERLMAARVLIVGAGGLGCPLALYLAASGIGRLAIVDDDEIELSNLHRQIAFNTHEVGQSKAQILARQLQALNPDCEIISITERLGSDNADELIQGFDIIADGSDNIATRLLVHNTAMIRNKPVVSAAVQGFDGQLTIYRAFVGEDYPCVHCFAPENTDESLLPSCAGGGVLGPAAGVMGSMQAIEVIKLALGMSSDLEKSMLIYDARSQEIMTIALKRDPNCHFCNKLP